MKKLFILLAAVTVGMFAKASDDLLILEEGTLDFWSQTGKWATISVDFSKATVVEFGNKNKVKEDFGTIEQYNRMKGEDFVRDWPGVEMTLQNHAATSASMANKKKGIKVISPQSPTMLSALNNMTEEQKKQVTKEWPKQEKYGTYYRDYNEATYDFIITIDTIDMGNAGAAAFKGAFGDMQYRGGAEAIGTFEVRDHNTQELVCRLHMNHVKGKGMFSETARLMYVFNRLWEDALPSLIKSQGKKK